MLIEEIHYQNVDQSSLKVVVSDGSPLFAPWPCHTWHAALIQEWLSAGNEIAPAPTPDPAEELERWRESTSVSRLQAIQALDDFGYLDQVEAIIANLPDTPQGRKTKRAWAEAQEFRRMSPTIIELLGLLELTPEQGDELFEYALTLEF